MCVIMVLMHVMHAGAYSNSAKGSGIVSIVLGYQPTQLVHALMSIHIKLNTYMHLHKARFQAYVTSSVLT